jgi:hypothetical protein
MIGCVNQTKSRWDSCGWLVVMKQLPLGLKKTNQEVGGLGGE